MEQDEIKALLARMEHLANARDVDGLMALHHVDATAFLFGHRVDQAGNRQHCVQGYAALRGAFSYAFTPLRISAGPQMAVVVGEEQIRGATDAGRFAARVHATYVFEKIDGRWWIVHQHLSSDV